MLSGTRIAGNAALGGGVLAAGGVALNNRPDNEYMTIQELLLTRDLIVVKDYELETIARDIEQHKSHLRPDHRFFSSSIKYNPNEKDGLKIDPEKLEGDCWVALRTRVSELVNSKNLLVLTGALCIRNYSILHHLQNMNGVDHVLSEQGDNSQERWKSNYALFRAFPGNQDKSFEDFKSYCVGLKNVLYRTYDSSSEKQSPSTCILEDSSIMEPI